MEFVMGFLTAYVLTWPGLLVLFFVGAFFERAELRPLAVIAGLATLVTAYFFFNLGALEALVYAGVYLFVGVFWSFWRYKRHVETAVEKLKTLDPKDYEYRKLKENLPPTEMLDTITAWIIIWPLSLVENVAADLIDGIQTLVKTVFKSVYAKIYASAMATLS